MGRKEDLWIAGEKYFLGLIWVGTVEIIFFFGMWSMGPFIRLFPFFSQLPYFGWLAGVLGWVGFFFCGFSLGYVSIGLKK